jgi:hypothetical protein
MGCRRGPTVGAEANAAEPDRRNLQGTCSELPSSCLSFSPPQRGPLACSLPEDETVLTLVRGVVVSVELIRPGWRRFWRHEVEDLSAPIIQQEIFGPVPTSEVFDDEKDPGGRHFGCR